MENSSKVLCIECLTLAAEIVLEPKYNGLRGRCSECHGDWPES
ncbi:MAG: hypothetical protein ACREAK_00440 [Nitrosarchaeum sp.]